MRTLVCSSVPLALLISSAALAAPEGEALSVRVDARDIARRLVHTSVTVPIPPERAGAPVALRYVEWTPGNHNPSGPIQNVVDFVARDNAGARLPWRRDGASVHRHLVDVPAGAGSIVVSFSYITNQPGVNSRSSDTYGYETFGGLNWNTVLVYPEWAGRSDTQVDASLLLPEGWKSATALARPARPAQPGAGEPETFARCSLAELVDSPVIFGANLRTWDLGGAPARGGEMVPHYLHAVAPRAEQLELPEKRVEKLRAMVAQSAAYFGPSPYDRFHFLIMLGDELPGLGLEHATSTYISMKEDRFTKAEGDDGDPMTVVPHELAHVWCGKFAAPASLHHDNYHTPCDTALLWAYEGLASYADEVIAARSGLMTREEYEHSLVGAIVAYQNQAGRRWRSVEDTALAMRFLRAPSDAWPDLRRAQDYYVEGGLFWMTADAIIRAGTSGDGAPRSIEHCVRALMGARPGDTARPGVATREYSREDIVAALRAAYDGQDWDALIRDMIESPREGEGAMFDLPQRLGYRLEWSAEPTEKQKKDEKKEEGASLRWSIGLAADKSGKVTRITPELPADRARVLLNDRIIGVRAAKAGEAGAPSADPGDMLAFTPSRLRDAVRASEKTGRVELLVQRGDRIEPVSLEFDGGLKYARLVRDESRPDVLSAILTAR